MDINGGYQYQHIGGSTGGPISIIATGNSFAPRWKFCPDCGTSLPGDWKHCAGCGRLIGSLAMPGICYPAVFPSAT